MYIPADIVTMGQNARSLLNALMDNCRTLAYHSGYSPTPLFNCPNDLLQQHGHILFLYAFIKNLYKWSEVKGIHAYTPNIRRLFNAELLEQAQSDDPNSRSNVDVNNGPLNRVKELVEKHFRPAKILADLTLTPMCKNSKRISAYF